MTLAPAPPLMVTRMSFEPLDPSRDQARQWAVEELSRREYAQAQPGVLERVADWLAAQLRTMIDSLGSVGSPGRALAVGLVAVVLLALVGYAIWRFGGPGGLRAARAADPLFGERGPLPAVEHRRMAEQAQREGDWDRAVLEWFRATVRELEERTVLAARPGRTAGEVSTEAGLALPDAAGPLEEAAHVFDEICYGGRTATGDSARVVRAGDEAVRAAKAVLT